MSSTDREMPLLHSYNYNKGVGVSNQMTLMGRIEQLSDWQPNVLDKYEAKSISETMRQAQSAREKQLTDFLARSEERKEEVMARRMVQVYIVDPDEQVSVDQALIYKSEPKITDLTDQELFYEIDIINKLKAHNVLRTTIINKNIKERTEFLEPARIRDLSMLVVTLAQFSKSK